MTGGSKAVASADGGALTAGAAWAAALVLAPFADFGPGTTAAAWGLGAVLLVLVFPWLLVRVLSRRGDLRQSIARAGAGPVVIGAGALCFMLLRLILWLDGPRSLAAVVFAMIAAFTLTLVLPERIRPERAALSLGAAVVILPFLLAKFLEAPGALAAGGAVLLLCAAGLVWTRSRSWPGTLGSAGAGAVMGGGLFWLLQALPG